MSHTALTDIPALIGISYRQADYWTRTKLIDSHFIDRTTGASVHPKFADFCGTGMIRVINDDELEVMTLMADLVGAGMLPKQAAALSRRLIAEPLGEVTVGRVLLAYRPDKESA